MEKPTAKHDGLRNCKESTDRETLKHDRYGGPYEVRKTEDQGVPDWVWVWMNDMAKWGRDVRQDIKDIENKLGMSPGGDPGDPPPPPPDNN